MLNPRISELRYNLITYFNLDELKAVAFDLYINPETLRHQTLPEMSISLISYCARSNLIPQLIDICKHERPNTNWPELSKSDLLFLSRDDFFEDTNVNNIDNSINFISEIGEMSGGSIIQSENIYLSPNVVTDCPDCYATGFEHEICSNCGGSGRERYYVAPHKHSDESQADSPTGLKNIFISIATDFLNNLGIEDPDNWHQRTCNLCNGEGVTLFTYDKHFLRRDCPTCRGTRQVKLINDTYSSAYTTIRIQRNENATTWKGKVIEIAILIDSKLVGYLKTEPLHIKLKKGHHELTAKYYMEERSKYVSVFETADLDSCEIRCSIEKYNNSYSGGRYYWRARIDWRRV